MYGDDDDDDDDDGNGYEGDEQDMKEEQCDGGCGKWVRRWSRPSP